MGKGLLIIILGSSLTLGIVSFSLVNTANSGFENAFEYYDDIQARNMGNSMVNFLLTRIADSLEYRTNGYEYKTFGEGNSVKYRVIDAAFEEGGDTLIKIEAIVNFNGYPKTITSYSNLPSAGGWVPAAVRGAWTANADLNNTISDMVIDGRDHDLNLNVIPNSGTRGVSSSSAFTNDDNAEIGGTYNGVDYVTKYPEAAEVIEESYEWNGGFPDSPDKLLGYPEGTLKSIAQSGAGGSQYLFNPKVTDLDEKVLSFPLSGVTYIELTDGVERQLKMQGMGNSGLVVVHGPGASSRLTGVKMEELELGKSETIVCHMWNTANEITKVINNDALADHLAHGDIQETCGGNYTWFQGLIITDYSFHHHIDVLGAFIQLSPALEASKACNGNADHFVNFSREAIINATQFVADESGLVGNSDNLLYVNKGFGIGRQKTAYFYE